MSSPVPIWTPNRFCRFTKGQRVVIRKSIYNPTEIGAVFDFESHNEMSYLIDDAGQQRVVHGDEISTVKTNQTEK